MAGGGKLRTTVRFDVAVCGAGGTAFDKNEIRKNIFAVAAWNRLWFEFPDSIAFADIEHCSALAASSWVRAARYEPPLPVLTLQYPNFSPRFPNKMRGISVLQPSDLVLYRAAAGRLAHTTDASLSGNVYSYRLSCNTRGDTAWQFRDRRKTYGDLVNKAVELLRSGRYGAMCETDVSSYYGSIKNNLLERALGGRGCDPKTVDEVMRRISHWQTVDGVRGLPVGPEASAVLGNFFLRQLDEALNRAGVSHLRYMDDVLIFTRDAHDQAAAVAMMDQELATLQLQRSEPKTSYFDEPREAEAHLRNASLASLGFMLRHDYRCGTDALHAALDGLLDDEPERVKRRLHWILTALEKRGDTYGCVLLAQNAPFTNLDPQAVADYMMLGLGDRQSKMRMVDGLMNQLAGPSREDSHARDLHLLRVLAETKTGETEGRRIFQIAIDPQRPWLVRCWAWRAYAVSAACRDETLMEAGREESELNVHRGLVASLRFSSRGGRRRRKSFLKEAAHRPNARFTVEWVRSAA
jgi:hypothetical protein